MSLIDSDKIRKGVDAQLKAQRHADHCDFVSRAAEKILRAIVSSGNEAIGQKEASYMVDTAFMVAETFVAETERRYAKQG